MNKTPTQLERIRAAVAEVWAPANDETIASVLEKHYRLSAETEADPGAYDLENNPYWRKILNCCDDPDVRRVTLIKSTQVGGTITTQGILLAAAVVDPAPAMYVCPVRDEVKIQRDRMYGNALASGDPISDLVPEKRRWSMDVMRLGASNVNLAYSNSPQRLRGKPCKRVILNETDTYVYRGDAGNPHRSAIERTKQFFDSLIFEESTPVGDASHIAAQWDRSNQERYNVECPHCGRWQEFRFFTARDGKHINCGGVAGYRDENGDLLDAEVAKKSAYYVCVNGCRIEQHFKNSMVTDADARGGGWAPSGCWYENDADGKPQLKGTPKRSREHSGFHVWTILQSKISIGQIAAEYVDAYNDGRLRDFVQNWLGLRYTVGRRIPGWQTVAKNYARAYDRGVIPSSAWFLTMAADVQEDLIYWLAVAWGPMRTAYIIDWGEIYKNDSAEGGAILSSDINRFPVMVNKVWKIDGVNPRGEKEIRARLSGSDSNYRVAEVHEMVKRFGDEKRLRCLRGDDTLSKTQKNYRRSVIEENQSTGEKYSGGGLVQYQIYKTYYQDLISEQLSAAADQLGALHLPVDVLPDGKKLLRQLTNVRKNQRGYYETINGVLGKDYRDCLGYCGALADMIVDDTITDRRDRRRRWTENAWRRAMVNESRRRTARRGNANILDR